MYKLMDVWEGFDMRVNWGRLDMPPLGLRLISFAGLSPPFSSS
jgi:hypothetical protein